MGIFALIEVFNILIVVSTQKPSNHNNTEGKKLNKINGATGTCRTTPKDFIFMLTETQKKRRKTLIEKNIWKIMAENLPN